MTFLRNFWYCAGWSDDFSRKPLERTLLGEKLAFYRKEDGGIAAIGNVCPHRFAPLHLGTLDGDTLACPYHGLAFDGTGRCALNPHGDVIPPTLRVSSYPVVERQGVAWIWMGDAALADSARIPELTGHGGEGWTTVHGMLHVKGSYELVADNLLDLSHVQYLHTLIRVERDAETRPHFAVEQDGDVIHSINSSFNTPRFAFIDLIWPDGPQRVDVHAGVRWEAPANMLLHTHFVRVDAPVDDPDGCRLYGAELITPESETSCHYFWSSTRDFRLEDEGLSNALAGAIQAVFTNEDAWMIGMVQENMGEETDLIAMRPVILPTDNAAVRARRIVRKLLREEAESAGPAVSSRLKAAASAA